MGVYLRAKFDVSSIILTSFRQGGNFSPPPSKRTPKKATQIRVNANLQNLFRDVVYYKILRCTTS